MSDYNPDCEYCDGKLFVISFTCSTRIPLTEEGFSMDSMHFCDTEDEMVQCNTCKRVCSLAEVAE